MIGYNMYTYCNNNPVNELDTTGTWPRWITETVVAVAIVVCLGATLSGNVPLATAAWKVGAVATGVLIAQTVHYDVRENLNQINGGVPEKEPSKEKIVTEGIDPGVAADCHQITAEEGYPNKKYCWPDGREAIYNSSGDLVTDSRDVGTYNFFVPTSPGRKILHGVFDVFPWVFLGNNDDDWGPIVNYPVKFLKGVFS